MVKSTERCIRFGVKLIPFVLSFVIGVQSNGEKDKFGVDPSHAVSLHHGRVKRQEVSDVLDNDHGPVFVLSSYAATFPEDLAIGTSVLEVKAVDGDSGTNAELVYSVDHDNFDVQTVGRSSSSGPEYVGIIVVKKRLDYDRLPGHLYSFTVTATDKGTPAASGTANVRVFMTNVNDEPPIINFEYQRLDIREDAQVGRVVTVIQASDLDKDQVKLYFSPQLTRYEIFEIIPTSGLIRLAQTVPAGRDDYVLYITAVDDGSCCGGSVQLSSEAYLNVEIVDINTHKPSFPNCAGYNNATILENKPASSLVIRVQAVDEDRGENGKVTYEILKSTIQPRNHFYINDTGHITSAMNFDRESQSTYSITVRGTDRGVPPLKGYCTFKVSIGDVNDNAPKFDFPAYTATISESYEIGRSVITVRADDADLGINAEIVYSMVDNIDGRFWIERDVGIILLNKSLELDSEYSLEVVAKDKGTPPLETTVNVTVINRANSTAHISKISTNDNPPYFPSPYNASVREDASVQQSVVTVSARHPDDASVLTYSITTGDVQEAFGIQAQSGVIFVARQLDYETEQHIYSLQITVSDGVHINTTTAAIHVLDANDNSPVFAEDPYIITDVVEEDTSITPVNKRLLATVTATDADVDRPTSIRFSLFGFGTAYPNKYFEIEADTGRLYLLTSLDRDLPAGRQNYRFNIRAQDEPDPLPGSTDLDRPQFGYTSVQVKPIDINDNAPIYLSNLEGSVAEHSARDSAVMTVFAIDYDEGLNGAIKYEIVDGPSDNTEMKFSILENTGLIVTSTDGSGLDREITPTYKVVVKASDRGNTSRSTDAVVTINLDDINDQIPVFEKEIYKVTMSEAQTSGSIARVKATDMDIGENARLYYSQSNHLELFDVENIHGEGSIVVYMAVDYEDVNQRFFNLTVIVQDPDPSHKATAHVEVTVEDFNDNAPIFVNPRKEVQKFENAPVGTFLAHFSAYDADSETNAVFMYSVDLKSDPDRLFSIDVNGNVTIRKMMDRDKQDHHEVFILATDRGDPAQTGTATLVVTVLDVNDNFPNFARDYRPIVMENADVVPESVIVVSAVDLDNDPFGPPFGFSETKCSDGSDTCPCDGRPTCNDFSLEFIPGGDGGKGTAKISTTRVFDREKQKFYHMPIVMLDMRDKGDPRAMTVTNTLTIEIGDMNDNVQKPGHQDIFVYNYKGMFGPLKIGTVYAIDPDDWDLVDKTFTYTGPKYMKRFFTVETDTGMITMAKGVPGNKAHTFTVDVYDRVWDVTVECTVTVTIQDISEEAVFSSGAVRLKGITAEEFVRRPKINTYDKTAYASSKYDRFRTFVSRTLRLPLGNVDVFSVQNKGDFTDVRFSAHGQYYYPASKMNSIIAVHKAQVENQVDVQIEQVPIDECTHERFEDGCYNFLTVTGNPELVNSNGTSFVGVEMFVHAMEGCRSDSYPPSDKCSTDYCHNGGNCSQDDWGDVSCSCPPGFDGPRCQGTHHSFDGNSYALYEPLEQCENSRTSLYIITTELDGLILYNGPTDDLKPYSEEPTDFISLELSGGYPRLRIDHGSGVLELYVDGRNQHGIAKMQRLNDGQWHRIDIIRRGREVEMIVDHCDTADIGADETVRDDKMCRQSGITPDENKFLNVRTPLQLGGRFSAPNYPTGIMPTKFNGCVKNLIHNGKLYDLTVPGSSDFGYPSGANRCTREDVICGVNSQGVPVCGDNGICESTWQPDTTTCICKPGYMGYKCHYETIARNMDKQSFFQWRLKNSFFNSVSARKLKMNMMFTTRDTDGVLWTVSSTTNNIVIQLQILSGRLTLTYNLGDGIRNLELYNRFVSNGAWHATVAERNGGEFILKMDNGEGPNFNFTYGFPDDKQEMHIENEVFAGAILSYAETLPVLASDLEQTCVRDIRMNNELFPMESYEDSKSNAATLSKAQNVKEGCTRNDCPDNSQCPPGQICYPLWGTVECRCPEHYQNSYGICTPFNYCANNECFGGATCQVMLNEQKKYQCQCPPRWQGEFCDTEEIVSKGSIVDISVYLLFQSVLLFFVLILK